MKIGPQHFLDDDFKSKTGPVLRVLVVDDNPKSAKTIGWMIETLGHKVQIAFDGKTAIENAKEFAPHTILLDLGMPQMNGYELCQIMKQSPELRGTIFIAQTGWSQQEYEELSKEAGFDHYLRKPINIDTLQTLLSSIIKTANAQ